MKYTACLFLFLFSIFIYPTDEKNMNNPFFKEWTTPFKTPPFNEIKSEHYLPAFAEGILRQNAETDLIVDNKEKPTFKNTIEALEKSGELLRTASAVFFNLNAANTNDTMQEIARKAAPMLSRHSDEINLNVKLFERVKYIYDMRDKLDLTTEQKTVLSNYYSDFIRGGVNLNPEEKERLKKINSELALLGIKFSENILKETNSCALVIDKKEDLAGLPDPIIKEASIKAEEKGFPGKWAFTLQKTSLTPFLQYSQNRELREKIYKAYISRGNNNDESDNKKIVARTAVLRLKKANLLGYKTYANFALEKRMAKNPETVYDFMGKLMKPALKRAKTEIAEMQEIINKEGNTFKLQAWDWTYYAEKLKKEKYDLDEEMLRPYLKLENVRAGAFAVANKLYGLQFVERTDIQVYQPDVKVFEVKEADGKHVGILYLDYFPRDGKETGAWCNGFRSQSNIDGVFVTPIVYNVANLAKPTADKPSLLNFEEATTIFHEFGHAIHALVSNITYPDGAGRIPVDFVELPSQVLENWASDPEVIKMYAKHYKTGETMPEKLIDKIENARLFNQGFECTELFAASLLDMDWHTITDTIPKDVNEFEKASIDKMGLIPEIAPRYQSTNFRHIFNDDEYAAGYYGYTWAQVLDADVFQAFKSKGDLFDQKLAASFRYDLLAKQGSDDPMNLYKKFMGREPQIDALLRKKGLE